MRRTAVIVVFGATIIAAATAFAQLGTQTAPASAVTALPDVVGIRPGISAQEAYNLLKARAPKALIGVGQIPIDGVSEKPVPSLMSIKNVDADPVEIITVWLTMPPSKQVVWAVGRTIEYEQSKQVLANTVIAGLRQKYGLEADNQHEYWAYNKDGKPSTNADRQGVYCNGNWTLSIAAPEGPTYSAFTPLLYTPGTRGLCDSIVAVRATLEGPQSSEYVFRVTVTLSDLALARDSQDAYQAFLANAAAVKQKDELDKAKQQKAPTF